MISSSPKQFLQDLLSKADITVNGNAPWDIQINNEEFYRNILRYGSLGLGESYMAGWWDCQALDQFIAKVLRAHLDREVKQNWRLIFQAIMHRFFNFQTKSRALEVGKKHYDIGNDLYQAMLDESLMYSCAYWKNANNLEQAQQAKLHLICEKLQLKPGMRLLDIGCGWGGLALHAARFFDAEVVGITISKRQYEMATERCRGYPVEIRFQDYRDVNEKFDRIVSVGMFEHVGHKNYSTYMKMVHRCLEDDGLFLLHTIGATLSDFLGDPWLMKYIFPNGMLPSTKQIGAATENLFIIEDWHNFGADYDKTLLAWWENFKKAWPRLQSKYDDEFYRMWQYYLQSCAGIFRSRHIQLWQIVFSKYGVLGGYQSIR